jgi:TrmH family RNA methyltransferase
MAAGVNKRNISIVLNKPKYPGNIGSVARCAANTGIGKIVVVNCENPDQDKIRQMATHLAAGTVERIRFTDSLEEALSGFHYIVGTTSRLGGARSASLYPREIAAELVDLSQHNEIALLFGPEDFGLTNEELKHCNCLVTIPTSEDLKSINLSHAVMILCYEIFLAGQDGKRAGRNVRTADRRAHEDRFHQSREPGLLDDEPPPFSLPRQAVLKGSADHPRHLPPDRLVRTEQKNLTFTHRELNSLTSLSPLFLNAQTPKGEKHD